jgi:hypothetical protein
LGRNLKKIKERNKDMRTKKLLNELLKKHELFEKALKDIQNTFISGNYERQDETYFTRKIDELGRIVLPMDLREKFSVIDGQDRFEIYTKDNLIIMRKA